MDTLENIMFNWNKCIVPDICSNSGFSNLSKKNALWWKIVMENEQ